MMSVWIKKVNVINLGPLGDRSFEFGKLNLIYGKNETGKTYLTEFMLRSIFKHPSVSKWPLRDITGQGKVVVSGIEEGKDTSFTPASQKKIEDFWEEAESGFPTNMARLLVVKGGELQLIQSDKESNRSILSNVFSQNALFEKVLGSIPATIQNSEIINGEISGGNRGDISARSKLVNQRKNIDQLINEIETDYSFGPLREKEIEKEILIRKIKTQEEAKRYHAYDLNKQIDSLEKEVVSGDRLEILHDAIRDYKTTADDLESLQSDLEEKDAVIQDFTYLDNAVQTWMELGLESIRKPGRANLIFAVAFLVLGLLSAAVGLVISSQFGNWKSALDILSFCVFLIASGLIGIYIRRLRQWAEIISQAEEREAIKEGYQTRFRKPIKGLADLKTHLELIRNDYVMAINLPDQIEDVEREKKRFLGVIREVFLEISGNELKSSEWDNAYREIKIQQSEKINEVRKLEKLLAGLVLDEEEYRSEPVEEAYCQEELEKLNERKIEIEHEIYIIENDLNSLKDRARQETGDNISEDWTTILGNLYMIREDLENEYKTITAKIIGEIGVTRIVQNLQQKEEEKVREGLQSKRVVDILSTVTGHYQSLDMDGEQLTVMGDYGDYNVDDILSTGAREQVFLALRMGFASKFAGGNPLFMILDDAFQHSDWDRRDRLFDVVFSLIDLGWQITYLTMDNHIREKIQKLGEKRLSNEFHFYSLPDD